MAKYSFELKKEIVTAYFNGEGGYKYLAKNIENAFLKELRRLRLEDEARMRELRSSSAPSEENSN